MAEGEWSPNGKVWHTCGGSEGCMCVYYQDPPIHDRQAPNRRGVVVFEVTHEMAVRAWGNYSHPGDDATEAEEIEAMRVALVAALNQNERQT